MSAPARVGWCPGARRPMASGDGLILRVKPRGGVLSLPQARRVAEVARRHGHGVIDLTSHANLQIRGLDERTHAAALSALDEVGLVDGNAEAEAVRNIIASPLAGLDPDAVLDIRRLVTALERRLTQDRDLHRLPAKFCFAVDDGGAPGLGGVRADVGFQAVWRDNVPAFVVRLGDDDAAMGICAPCALVDTAAALAGLMVDAHAADPELRRMRDLVRREGASALFERVRLPSPLRGEGARRPDEGFFDARQNPSSGLTAIVSPKERRDGGRPFPYVSAAPPFGRMTADQWAKVGDIAGVAGAADLRLTPWRAILIADPVGEAAAVAARACAALGLIVDAADPRLSVAACPGAPGCHRGSTPVLADAARLAQSLNASGAPGAIALHVSGCAKGCAHAGRAPVTLVGRDGLYDIVIEGRAADPPRWRGLTIEAAELRLAASPWQAGAA